MSDSTVVPSGAERQPEEAVAGERKEPPTPAPDEPLIEAPEEPEDPAAPQLRPGWEPA